MAQTRASKKDTGVFRYTRERLFASQASTSVASPQKIIFVLSSEVSQFEFEQVAFTMRDLTTRIGESVFQFTIIDGKGDVCHLIHELSVTPLDNTLIITFGSWATALVNQHLAQHYTPTQQGRPFHLYACGTGSEGLSGLRGKHMATRGVHTASLSYKVLIDRLSLIYPHARRIFVPFDRALFARVPEAVWPIFHHDFTDAARMKGFEVIYVGSPVLDRARPGDIVLTLPDSGIEPHMPTLLQICKQTRLFLCSHSADTFRRGAALCFGSSMSRSYKEIVQLITQLLSTVPRETINDRWLDEAPLLCDVQVCQKLGVRFTKKEKMLLGIKIDTQIQGRTLK